MAKHLKLSHILGLMQLAYINIPWILDQRDYNCSGIHGVLYICLNKRIRRHVKGIFGCQSTSGSMQIVYVNIPWILDEKEYNCSGRSSNEWRQRGTTRELLATFFLILGTSLAAAYVLSMMAMVRGKFMHIPCYRLMFFNGILDLIVLLCGSLIVAYLLFVS
ncbi:hypothetical protein GCK32_002932, partial [Trichostrongylus colubriformis]